MGRGAKLRIGLVLLAAVLGAFWLLWMPEGGAPVHPSAHVPGPSRTLAPEQPVETRLGSEGARSGEVAEEAAPEDGVREALSGTPRLLHGRLVDRGGTGVAGAVWQIVRADSSSFSFRIPNWRSDAQGRFEFLLNDSVNASILVVEHPEFLPARFELAAQELAANPLEFVLVARPELRVRLMDILGRPVEAPARAWAEVQASGASSKQRIELERAADGLWRTRRLPIGILIDIAGRARGSGSALERVERELVAEGILDFELVLPEGRRLSGVVLDARTRAPIADARVWGEEMHPQQEGVTPMAQSDAAGRFELVGIEPLERQREGERERSLYLVGARAEGYADRLLGGHVVASAELRPHIEVILEPALARLDVRVRHAHDGRPGACYRVQACDSLGTRREGVSDEEGLVSLEGLAAGTVALWAEPLSGLAAEEDGCAALEVDIALDQRAPVEVWLRPPANLEGFLRDLRGVPIAGVPLTLRCFEGLQRGLVELGTFEVATDADGFFALPPLPPGRVAISFGRGYGGDLCLHPEAGNVELESGAIRVELAADVCVEVRGGVRPGISLACAVALVDGKSGRVVGRVGLGLQGEFLFRRVFPAPTELRLLRGEEVLDRVAIPGTGAQGVLLGVVEGR